MTRIASHRRLPKALFLTCALPLLACMALPAASETPTPLPYPEGQSTDIRETNANRTIIGNATAASGNVTGLVWRNGAYETLTAPDYANSYALALNDADEIVGTVYGGKSATAEPVIWKDGAASLLPTLGTGGAAYDINEAGDIVGIVFKRDAEGDSNVPAIWRSGQLNELTTGDFRNVQPFSIDDNGIIYGIATMAEGDKQVPVTWIDGAISALPINYGASGEGGVMIEGAKVGFATGIARLIDPDVPGRVINTAVAWENGIFRVLEKPTAKGESDASDVNRKGQYAGSIKNERGETVPVIWSKDGVNLLPTIAGRKIVATALNDTGYVAGVDATNADLLVPFVWDLAPELSISMADVTAAAGQTVPLRASVTRQGSPQPNQKVAFAINGKPLGYALTNAKGVATKAYLVPMNAAGVIKSTASAGGTKDAASATAVRNVIVGKSPTVASVTPVAGAAGQRVSVTANLGLKLQNTALAGKSVSVLVNGRAIGRTTTDKSGVARTSIVIPAGTAVGASVPVEIRYSGDSTSKASVGRVSAYVTK